MDAREMSADEAVLDIYAAQGAKVWRIVASNFDFSCLGAQKKLGGRTKLFDVGRIVKGALASSLLR